MNAPIIRSLTVQHINDALRKLAQSLTTISDSSIKTGAPINYNIITGLPTEFVPTAHSHIESDITNLVADLASISDNGVQVQRDIIPESENWIVESDEQLLVYGALTIYGTLSNSGKVAML